MRLFLVYCVVWLVAAHPAVAQDTLYFAIRIDDIQSRSSIGPRSLRPLEEIVEERGARLTYAVIPHRLVEPQNADGVLAAELRASASRGHEILQHGYDHVCDRCLQADHEMFCARDQVPWPYDKQLQLVDEGANLLRSLVGVSPTGFVPPGHHADGTTFRVLQDLGFDILSSSGRAGYAEAGLYNVPTNDEFTWSMTQADFDGMLRKALADIRASRGIYTLLMHDPFTRPGYQDGLVLSWTAALLDSLLQEYGDRVVFTTVSEQSRRWLATRRESLERPESAVADAVAWPNPTRDVVNLDRRLHGTLEVVDAVGRIVRVFESVDPGEPVDLAGLRPGGYVVRERRGGSAVRVVVLR